MTKKIIMCAALLLCMATESVQAGGLLTNTNQNIAFVRNMARDGAIGIDGVYSNPAGVAFLKDGFHLSINIQNAHQTRTATTSFPLFVNNYKNGELPHVFKGTADVPVLPSLQAAYNKNKWSFQFAFAVGGGGGKCGFDDGLGSFEQVVSGVGTYAPQLNALYQQLGVSGLPGMAEMSQHQMGTRYDYESYMRGRQYGYYVTAGAARRLTPTLSVYGGLRLQYSSNNYYGYVRNIQIEHIQGGQSQMVNASQHFADLSATLNRYAGAMEILSQVAAAQGQTQQAAGYAQQAKTLDGAAAQTTQLSQGTQDIELNCDQIGWGVTPIIGIDWHPGKLNLAAKYEFKTRMRLKNKAANSLSAAGLPMLDRFKDGKRVAEDTPALLTVGAQYEILPSLRVMAGWHHYFDVDTKQYTKEMLGDTNEYLAGAEYDITKWLQVSAGMQRTKYGIKDAGISDIKFDLDSYSYGFGFGVQVSEKVKVNVGYFQTLYNDYDKVTEVEPGVTKTDKFARTNRVIGLGVDLTL